jgi:phosphorylase kinase alpha/beta subunit
MVVTATQTQQNQEHIDAVLERLDRSIETVVLQRQDPISGLLPASTAHTIHGNYGDAWVRDCVYSIQCVWALAMAHRNRPGNHDQRAWELEQRVIALMRGLLRAMLRQADKVERFKRSLDPLDALHAKYDSSSGDPVVADDAWGHLQLDASSLFLLQLAQLTRGGCTVIQSRDEADFIQNLVYYVARAYRTPDYGIWERGDKGNHGLPERNASSIGMAKAALESLDGLDLFGIHGDGSRQIVIPQGALVRLRRALKNLLPRESASKEADSACLSVVGYPAWAVEDQGLVQRTLRRIRRELGGAYGYKRFLRDGHQTAVEDVSRLHYEPEELAEFEGIESEWPLFLAYELVTACFEERWDDARSWQQRLAGLAVHQDGEALYPELYRLADDRIEAERQQPGSQPRKANTNVPLIWTQSLVWLGEMLLERLISPEDLDPCGRRQPVQLGATSVLVAFAPETTTVRDALRQAGLPIDSESSISIEPSDVLAGRLQRVGANRRLGLSGHPPLRIETEDTARFYRQGTRRLAFTAAGFEEGVSYLADDPRQLVDSLVDEIHLLQRHWRGQGLPLLLIPVSAESFQHHPEAVLQLGQTLKTGHIGGIPVQFDQLSELAIQGSWVELPEETAVPDMPDMATQRHTGLLRDAKDLRDLTAAEEQELDETETDALRTRLWATESLHEQAEVLELLHRRFGSQAFETSPDGRTVALKRLLEEVYLHGLRCQDWSVVRRCAGAMGMVHPQLEDALTDLLVRQKQVVVGRNYSAESRLSRPMDSGAIADRIQRTSGVDGRERMLEQELLLALDGVARRDPGLLKGILTLQLSQLLLLLTSELAAERQLSQDEAFEALCSTSPHLIRDRLRALLSDVEHARAALQRGEQLHVSGRVQWKVPDPLEQSPSGGDWLQHRIRLGSLQKVPRDFYAGIWSLLQHCRGLVIGDKLERRNRLNSRLILEKTAGERNFATLVEHLLSRVNAPEYRQLCTECLLSLMAFVEANPEVRFDDDLALDVVIGHAVRVGWQQTHPSLTPDSYSQHKDRAWSQFYAASPGDCRRWQIAALRELAEQEGLV